MKDLLVCDIKHQPHNHDSMTLPVIKQNADLSLGPAVVMAKYLVSKTLPKSMDSGYSVTHAAVVEAEHNQ